MKLAEAWLGCVGYGDGGLYSSLEACMEFALLGVDSVVVVFVCLC